MSDNRTLEERLLNLCTPVPESGCWLWLGQSMRHFDYGLIRFNLKKTTAHRASWTAFKGPIPKGMSVLHKCDTASCINPDHLYLGTQLDNMRDRKERKRYAPHLGNKNHATRISDEAVEEILKSDLPTAELAKIYGCTPSGIYFIRTGRRTGARGKEVTKPIARLRKGEKSSQSKLTELQVVEILCDPRPQHVIAKDYGVSRSCIQGIKNRRNWPHVELPNDAQGCGRTKPRTTEV